MLRQLACAALLGTRDRAVLRALRQLREAEHMSAQDLEAEQRRRLAALVRHAYENVPYYRKILKQAGVISGNGVDLSRWSEIPILTRQDLRERYDDLKSRDLAQRAWYENATGGSTGEPVRFVQDASYSAWMRAVKMLFDLWTGYKIGEPKVILWGSERDLSGGQGNFRMLLGHWLRNERWLNARRLSDDSVREYVKVINRMRPVQILAYATSLYELAQLIERDGRDGLEVYAPRAIMTSADTLYPHMRELIERVFRAPVFNRYGSREAGDIACQCEVHGALHVSPLTHYVEIIRGDGSLARDGEIGEVIVTPLANYAMPLIRYQIGDIAAWEKGGCSCGRKWPVLQTVYGRVRDSFHLRDGTIVRIPDSVLYFRDWICRFQFIQEDYDVVRLLVVPVVSPEEAKERVENERAGIEEKLRSLMGIECCLQIELVEEIPPTPSGKHRYVISKVPHDP
ncbi:MAG: phenylacetate--CoA ligase family protein [Candidatus Bipolaricaulis sp.]|nr:phenylacetate--CoA ligase family protein [Candidatus Bipolaricaulis sp.]